ncbi:MAG: hypothetical protein K6T88_01480 [Bacillus sp. (in: Bacteria)]|nr:hypothetical protein [Bacillus sp. (in: firmicutes)]
MTSSKLNTSEESNMSNELDSKMENVWEKTCGSWQNCTETTIQSFLAQCYEKNIDPHYCMGWVEKHRAHIPDWNAVSKISLDWVNQHTSTGSPISFTE